MGSLIYCGAGVMNDPVDVPLSNEEKLSVIGLRNSDPLYIDKLTIRELKYLISMIDPQERQWSGTYRKYVVALKGLEAAHTARP